MPFRGATLLAVALLIATGCAGAAGEPWQTVPGRDHPLTGRIWETRAGRFIEVPSLVEGLAAARFVLLGEKHDHPDHHRLQSRLLRALIGAGRRPAVAFEMFTVDDQAAIDHHLASAPTDAAGLGEAVGWAKRGWPDWSVYQPIAELALQAGLPIVATNLSRETTRALHRWGLPALDPSAARRLGLAGAPPADLRAEMAAEIREAHCGYVSGETLETMADVQWARDAGMAERLVGGATPDGAVLITGAGHARKDRGIPLHLARRSPGAPVASLAFVEVATDQTDPAAYGERFGQAAPPFDYVWFTPRLDDVDPCEKFEKELKRLKRQ